MNLREYLKAIKSCDSEVDAGQMLGELCSDGEMLIKDGKKAEGVAMLKAVLKFDRNNDLFYPAILNAEDRLWELGELARPSLDKYILKIKSELPAMDDYSARLALAKILLKSGRKYPQAPSMALRMLIDCDKERPLAGKDRILLLMCKSDHGPDWFGRSRSC
jgi:hypothetical protein